MDEIQSRINWGWLYGIHKKIAYYHLQTISRYVVEVPCLYVQ